MKKLKILIAGHDEPSSQLNSFYVQTFGKEIIYVKTGVDAVEECQNHPDIDLILMDISMIKMDGFEATRQIREFNKKVIILAQSSFTLTGAREMAINAGYSDYISKPIKREELIALIQRYFENKIIF